MLTIGLQISNLTRGQPILALGAGFYALLQLIVASYFMAKAWAFVSPIREFLSATTTASSADTGERAEPGAAQAVLDRRKQVGKLLWCE